MSAGTPIDRRNFLQLAGLAAGGLATLGSERWFAGRSAEWTFQETARALVQSLSPVQRQHVMLPWDHASRGVATHVACMTGAPRVADTLNGEQQMLVHRLYETMTSAEKRRRFGRLVGLEGGGLDPCALLLYGDPFEKEGRDFQVAISGGHLLIRGGGMTETGSAFGGPLGYGHQLGDGQPGLPGNAFAYHGDALNTFMTELPASSQARARVGETPPHETAVQLQAEGGTFRGLAAAGLDPAKREGLTQLVDTVLSCYAEEDREAAWGCIRRNGGVSALHLSVFESAGFYEDGAAWAGLSAEERGQRGMPYWHVWRIEGPGTVLHFRGWPHVHATIHLAEDGGARQHVGEALAHTETLMEDAAIRPILRAALRDFTEERLAYVADAIPARFVPGPVTTGTIWTLAPFDGEVAVMTIRGAAIPPPLRTAILEQGESVEDDRVYRLAMPDAFVGDPEQFGEPESVEASGVKVRGVYENWIRRNGLRGVA